MRRFARIDANQTAVITALRKLGCSVQSLASVGDGCPDILVGWRGRNFLMEVKDGEKAPSDRKLTAAEAHFLATWKGGPAVVVESEQEAINAVIAHARPW